MKFDEDVLSHHWGTQPAMAQSTPQGMGIKEDRDYEKNIILKFGNLEVTDWVNQMKNHAVVS